MLKSSAFLVGSRATIAVLRFMRTIVITQLISVEEYGIATTFVIVVSFVGLVSDLALERFVVQDRQGDRPKFIAAVQLISLLRAGALTFLMVLIAGDVALFFDHPELTWAYQTIAIIAGMRGFIHMDVYRQQRSLRFGKTIAMEFASVVSCLIVVWPLAVWLGDARVMLAILITEQAVATLLSLILAERRFRLRWDRTVLKRALRFSLPLLVSSLFGFAAMQGDRMIVANQFTAYELGLFGAAFTLAMTPSSFVASIARSLFLPLLAAQQTNPPALAELNKIITQALVIGGMITMLGFSILGPVVYVFVFGDKFAEGAPYMPLLGVMFAILIAREAPYSFAIAIGQTGALPFTVLARLISLPIAFWVVSRGGDMMDLLTVGVFGEVATFLVATVLLKRISPLQTIGFFLAINAVIVAVAGCILATAYLPEHRMLLNGVGVLICIGYMAASRELFAWLTPIAVKAGQAAASRLRGARA